jgi:hypothetical protein
MKCKNIYCYNHKSNWPNRKKVYGDCTDPWAEAMDGCKVRDRFNKECCKWHETDEAWETGCGEMFVLNDGTPMENKMKYCYACGRKIKVVKVR